MFNVPFDVKTLCSLFAINQFECYVVGGCVRDLLLGVEPKDWDLTTNATPEEIKEVLYLYKTIDTGIKHGTVTAVMNDINYEITTYRSDGNYTDGRHPDKVVWAKTIEEDLSRRDFTMNVIAYDPITKRLVDPFHGLQDINNKLIKCVGNPKDRYTEDALRMLRAVRFASQKNFIIEAETHSAITALSSTITKVSCERVKAELDKILMSDYSLEGFYLLGFTKLINYILPELLPMYGCAQFNPNHCYDVWHHTLVSLQNSEKDLITRWAVLLHDIGKPTSKVKGEDGFDHFYKHSVVSVELSSIILNRLKFDTESKCTILKLIEYHDYDLLAKKSAIKRLINKGVDIERWFKVRYADIQGHKLNTQEKNINNLKEVKELYFQIINEKEPFSVKDLAVNGNDIMNIFNIQPCKLVGEILKYLLDLVIEHPEHNTKNYLIKEVENFYIKMRRSI